LGGDLIVSRSQLLDNQALAGGGIAADAGAGDVLVFASVIKDNLATGSGGGVWCEECDNVTVIFSRLVDNITGELGGAIYAEGTRVLASTSRLSRNNANAGGGIWANYAVVQVLDSEMADNEADTTDGGAVNIGGTLNIERSTLAGNIAPAGGGGAVYMIGDGDFASANSTYSGNSALWGGGLGLAGNFGPGPDVLIGTSTFFNNESTFPNTAEHIFGVWNTFGLYNSIVANDLTTGAVFDPYCSGALTAGNHNLIDDASCDTGGVNFNLGQVMDLDPNLAYNGGPTRTHK
jgi:predicted outer membrane repeat protein